MTTKSTTPAITLPPTQPGYTPRRRTAAPKPKAVRPHNFHDWVQALRDAETAVGYDHQNSKIAHKSDVDVLSEAVSLIGAMPSNAETVAAYELVTELLKRRLAKQQAGKTYYGR